MLCRAHTPTTRTRANHNAEDLLCSSTHLVIESVRVRPVFQQGRDVLLSQRFLRAEPAAVPVESRGETPVAVLRARTRGWKCVCVRACVCVASGVDMCDEECQWTKLWLRLLVLIGFVECHASIRRGSKGKKINQKLEWSAKDTKATVGLEKTGDEHGS